MFTFTPLYKVDELREGKSPLANQKTDHVTDVVNFILREYHGPIFKMAHSKLHYKITYWFVGAYCPRYFMAPQHIDPAEAIKIHKDIKSNLSIGIHWGTFPMGSTEPYMEPKELIHKLQEESTEKTFITVDHGAIHEV